MKMQKISTLGMSREEWLKERRKSLGGSDMGAVLGLNKYRSPWVVWAEKTGRLGEEPENEAISSSTSRAAVKKRAACRCAG